MAPPINTIHCEDCLATMHRMPTDFINLTVTSPPYDDMRDYHGYKFDFSAIAKELLRVTTEGGVVVWIVSDKTIQGNETGRSFEQALHFKQVGFQLWDTMIFEKEVRGATGNNRGYWQVFDYMFIFCKGEPKAINLLMDRPNKESRQGDRGTKRLQNGQLQSLQRGGYAHFGRRTNIWKYSIGKGHSSKDAEAFEHPAIFPEALVRDHILSWSNKGDLVYDPFMGSGTTAKMAFLNDRNFIGSEISEEYCHLAEKRLEKFGWEADKLF